eukprot:CAMPEP_0113629448 /NCGR_PEP_ID=MMETSP0017_2-20120614/15285_1 /TAXON_ID=2856 /ORGANISM="Cylindrotheca closterium" /LENGTH=620 /DNA_ID=CAMNT_0000539843 /DNA_START=47 /DNA_END=1909 /DNA_ORIENTATION=- /assembly_acc=CAM_ASM_000147
MTAAVTTPQKETVSCPPTGSAGGGDQFEDADDSSSSAAEGQPISSSSCSSIKPTSTATTAMTEKPSPSPAAPPSTSTSPPSKSKSADTMNKDTTTVVVSPVTPEPDLSMATTMIQNNSTSAYAATGAKPNKTEKRTQQQQPHPQPPYLLPIPVPAAVAAAVAASTAPMIPTAASLNMNMLAAASALPSASMNMLVHASIAQLLVQRSQQQQQQQLCHLQLHQVPQQQDQQPPPPPPPKRKVGRPKKDKSAKKEKKPKPAKKSKAGVKYCNKQIDKWKVRYEEAKEYAKTNGHCMIPNEYPTNPLLGGWAKRQRYQYQVLKKGETTKIHPNGSRNSSISIERIRLLEDIGFCWQHKDHKWHARFDELAHFCKEYGHAAVPTTYEENQGLAGWVKVQRRQYKLFSLGKKSSMTPARIRLLNKLHFCWSIKDIAPLWVEEGTTNPNANDSRPLGGALAAAVVANIENTAAAVMGNYNNNNYNKEAPTSATDALKFLKQQADGSDNDEKVGSPASLKPSDKQEMSEAPQNNGEKNGMDVDVSSSLKQQLKDNAKEPPSSKTEAMEEDDPKAETTGTSTSIAEKKESSSLSSSSSDNKVMVDHDSERVKVVDEADAISALLSFGR